MSKSFVVTTATALLLATGSAHAISAGVGSSVSLPGVSVQLDAKAAADAQKAADAAAAAKAAATSKVTAAQAAASDKANAASASAQGSASAKFAKTDRAALRAYQASQAKAGGQQGLFNAAASRLTTTLPSGWKRDVKAGAQLNADVAAAGSKIDVSAVTGFGPKVEGSNVIIVQDRAILVDSKSSVVLDVITL